LRADSPVAAAPTSSPHAGRRIGRLLVDQGLVTEDQLRIALLEQPKTRLRLGRQLVQLGFVAEPVLRDALAIAFGVQAVELDHVIADAVALQLLPREMARRFRAFPLVYDRDTRTLVVALADAQDLMALDRLRAHVGAGVQIAARLAGEAEIERAIEEHYGRDFSIDGILREMESAERPGGPGVAPADEIAQPVVRLVAALLAEAVACGASDVHFEPEPNCLGVRYRIDGVLRPVHSLHLTFWPAMAVRLKVLARMNIAECRAPQDGRISANLAGRSVDFRVASLPTLYGENLVLRVLDRRAGIPPLAQLGLGAAHWAQLQRMMSRPEGLFLVTGPTGSGKTTTLYSILDHLNSDAVNIMTLEDPVEYPLPKIRQTTVAESAKIDFASGVRALLRQDPDVILIGEIRDEETAVMAFRAAMTGHQVFSTLHAHSAAGAIPRLLDMGIAPDLMTGNLIGVVAQRLVRRLCTACRQPYAAGTEERQALGLADGDSPVLYRAAGCDRCDYQGYRGRSAILEILRIDAQLDELIARRASARELAAAARAGGFRSLAEDGLRLLRDGTTSLEEIMRVVDLSDRWAATGRPA
jgi:type II secretory ATPase GspE/PulE/Tfp pilus assembly ATPase PilB-like protein